MFLTQPPRQKPARRAHVWETAGRRKENLLALSSAADGPFGGGTHIERLRNFDYETLLANPPMDRAH